MQVLNSRLGTVLVAMSMVMAAAIGGALIGQVTGADAVVSSGDRSVLVPIDPVRVLDTRPAPNGPIGVDAPAKLGAQQTMSLGIAGTKGIPVDATAAQLNVTTINASDESFLTVYPQGSPRPLASTMNPDLDVTSYNGAVIALGAAGGISIYNHVGSVDVIIDVTGYYVDHTHDDRYYTKSQGDARYVVDPGLEIVAAGQVGGPGNLIDSIGPVKAVDRIGDGDYRLDFTRNVLRSSTDPGLVVQVDAITADQINCHWFFNQPSRDSIGIRCAEGSANEDSHFNFIIYQLDQS